MITWTAALVVEDDALVRFDLAQTLEAEGFKTFEAADAEEAIAVLEANSEIKVVFTDIQMPGTMDGLALSHYVRKRWPPTIIVVSSGHHSPSKDEMPSGDASSGSLMRLRCSAKCSKKFVATRLRESREQSRR